MTVKGLIEMLSIYDDNALITDENREDFVHITNLTNGDVVLSTLKPIGICNRTGGQVYPTKTPGYLGFCTELYEDLFGFEMTLNETVL